MFSHLTRFFSPVSCCMSTVAVTVPEGALTQQMTLLLQQLSDGSNKRDYHSLSQLFAEVDKLANGERNFYCRQTPDAIQCIIKSYIVLAELLVENQMPAGASHLLRKSQLILDKYKVTNRKPAKWFDELIETIKQRDAEVKKTQAASQAQLNKIWVRSQMKKDTGSMSFSIADGSNRKLQSIPEDHISEDNQVNSFYSVS